MSRHFAAIGFALADSAALGRLAKDAARMAEATSSANPELPPLTLHWDLGRGLGVWVYARALDPKKPDGELEILACLPSFTPEDTMLLRAYRLAKLSSESGELLLIGLLPNGLEIRAALTNAAWRPALRGKGGELALHLAGLALESELFEASDAPRLVAPGSETPQTAALISLDTDGHHRVLGRVAAVREVANFYSGGRMWALAVETDALTLSLLAPIADFQRPPLVGDVYLGSVWLVASLPV